MFSDLDGGHVDVFAHTLLGKPGLTTYDFREPFRTKSPRPRCPGGPHGVTHPSPMASRCESSRDGRKTLRNSAEKTPPFFMTLVFLMLSVAVRFGCRNRNSLRGEGQL